MGVRLRPDFQSVGNAGEVPRVIRVKKEKRLCRGIAFVYAISQVAQVWVRKLLIQFLFHTVVMRIWN